MYGFATPAYFFSDSDLASKGGKNTFRAIAVDVVALNSVFFDFSLNRLFFFIGIACFNKG